MSTSADINPSYITSAAVSKQATRDQFTHVKEAIAATEDDIALGINGWRRLSTQTLLIAAAEVRCQLPDGYSRYRIEMSGINGVGNGQLMFRSSVDNVTYISAAASYDGPGVDTAVTLAPTQFQCGGTKGTITGSHSNTASGIVGSVEFDAGRLVADFRLVWINSVGTVRTMRHGFIAVPQTKWIQFYMTDGTVNLAAGSMFTVMAHL